MSGQKSRSGGNIPNWFEGGQMPIHRRLPMKGFNNIFKKSYRIVTLNRLSKIEKNVIDVQVMEKFRVIDSQKNKKFPVKVLSDAENKFDKKKTIKANSFSKKAIELIEKVGGKAEVV